MATRCFVHLTTFVIALLCALLVGLRPTDAAPTFPETETYQGTIESTSGTSWNSHGGTILLTFNTENELLRVEVRDFVYGVITLPTYQERLSTINKTMYYNSTPPNPDGTFGAAIPLGEFGMAGRSGLGIEGIVDSSKQASGTVTLSCSPLACGFNAPFAATEIDEMPGAAVDAVFSAEVEDGGELLFALDSEERVTALALRDVSFPNCPLGYSFNVVTFHDAPKNFEIGFRVYYQSFLSISGSQLPDGSWEGTINLQYGIHDDCGAEERWSTAGFPDQPSPEPTTGPMVQPTSAPPELATGRIRGQ